MVVVIMVIALVVIAVVVIGSSKYEFVSEVYIF